MDKKAVNGGASIFAGGDMTRIVSASFLDEFFTHTIASDISDRDDKIDGLYGVKDHSICSADLTFPFRNREIMNGFSSCGALTGSPLWSHNKTPKQSSISVTMDSQSSICVGSPTSATKPINQDNQAMGATSGSSGEQSDDEDLETEAGPCEQSTDNMDVKRIKRMVSNRESARRSRKRKQEQLADLEQQVEQLRGENSCLFKQLTDATQQFKDANTNNRVHKSDVEALRAKVKLAEDMVARGSLTSSLSHLQSHLNSPQSFSGHNMCRVGSVTPTIAVRGDDVSFQGLTVSGQNATLGLENVNAFNGNVKNGIMSDSASCVPDIWAWDSHVPTMSK